MTTIAVCSAKGSPGVSTLACILGAVWPEHRRVVVAECDPSGNDIAARFGLSPLVGMTSLILSTRRAQDAPFESHVQFLSGGLEVLIGPLSPEGARSLDRELAAVGIAATFSVSVDLIVDCGRLDPSSLGQRALILSADHVILLVRPDGAGIAHARAAVSSLTESNDRERSHWFVEVGPTPFDECDVAGVIGVPRAGTVPLDPVAASMVCGFPGRPRVLARSGLVYAARRIANLLAEPGNEQDDGQDEEHEPGSSERSERHTGGETRDRRDWLRRRPISVGAPIHAATDAGAGSDL